MKNILIIVASSGKNLTLANSFKENIEQKGEGCKLIELTSLSLPLYTTKREQKGIPDEVTPLLNSLNQTDGYVFISPEYNGGVPPILSNFLAWVSRSGDSDWRKYFNGKTTAIASCSGSGGMHVLMAMRMQLSYLGMSVLGRQIQVTKSKELNPQSVESVVENLLSSIL